MLLDLDDPQATDPGRAGADLAKLARARQAGLRVPTGAVLTVGADVVPCLDDLRVLWERLHPDGPVTVRIGSFAVDGVETWPRLLDAVADVRRAAGDERAAVLVRRDVGCVVGGVLPRRGAPVIVSGDPSGIADGLLSPVPTRLVGRGGGLRGADRARLLALRLTASRRLGGSDVLWVVGDDRRLWVVGVR